MAEEQQNGLVNFARKELELLGEDEDTIQAYLKVVQAFSEMEHSGESAFAAVRVLHQLFQFLNLTPLTDDPYEWQYITEDVWGETGGVWQCVRNGEAFSNDGGKSYYLLSEGGNDKHREPLHQTEHKELPTNLSADGEHTFCGPTDDEAVCACGCSGYDERCPLYLKHYHGTTQVPTSHVCCRIPGRT